MISTCAEIADSTTLMLTMNAVSLKRNGFATKKKQITATIFSQEQATEGRGSGGHLFAMSNLHSTSYSKTNDIPVAF